MTSETNNLSKNSAENLAKKDANNAKPQFVQISIEGVDAEKFLQGQLTCDVTKLGLSYQAAAICNLKGRIDFGIWIKRHGEQEFDMVISQDCSASLLAHLKKFGAFSKFTTKDPIDVYPCVIDGIPTFSQSSDHDSDDERASWMAASIDSGNYWIVAATQGEFQPQELRLHQRGGMDYDKGCYLGQEVIARIYFKSAPKAFLHLIKGNGALPNAGDKIDNVQIVNAIAADNGFKALVVARPEHLENSDFTILPLPEALQADVARQK